MPQPICLFIWHDIGMNYWQPNGKEEVEEEGTGKFVGFRNAKAPQVLSISFAKNKPAISSKSARKELQNTWRRKSLSLGDFVNFRFEKERSRAKFHKSMQKKEITAWTNYSLPECHGGAVFIAFFNRIAPGFIDIHGFLLFLALLFLWQIIIRLQRKRGNMVEK